MKRLFHHSTMDDMSMKGLLSLAAITGIAAGILVPLAMNAVGMIGSGQMVEAAVTTGEDVGNFSTAAGSE